MSERCPEVAERAQAGKVTSYPKVRATQDDGQPRSRAAAQSRCRCLGDHHSLRRQRWAQYL